MIQRIGETTLSPISSFYMLQCIYLHSANIFCSESEAAATNVFCSESEAAATNIFCSESEAAATNVFCIESIATATIMPRRN
ncbi:hypothetical protein [Lysinibacillus sp. NPDC047702]|uniref:hypothetical protein n=1 Tax=unclassified Lysinibacillus TaxID=2636778 RepID=UPI003CFFD410